MSDNTDTAVPHEVKIGEFPYPLSKGPKESPYLIWLRNHSNYMATKGFLDYFRMAGVLMRGILLNFLVLLSLLLMVSVVVSYLYAIQLQTKISRDLAREIVAVLVKEGVMFEAPPFEVNNKFREVHFNLVPDDGTMAFTQARDKLNNSLDLLKLHPPSGWIFVFRDKSDSEQDEHWLLRYINKDEPQSYPNRFRLGSSCLTEIKFCEDNSSRSWLKSPTMPAPFVMTGWVAAFSLVWVVFSPILVVLAEIVGQKKSIQRAGSDSSVRRRDLFEKTFGFALLLIATVALLETLPFLLEKFHHFRESNPDWDTIFASIVSISVAVMGGASKLLSYIGGAKKRLAMLLIGMLGLLAPLLLILYVTDYLVFAPTYITWKDAYLRNAALAVGVPGLFVIGIVFTILVGLAKRSFTPLEYVRLFGLLAVIIGVFILFGYVLYTYVVPYKDAVIPNGIPFLTLIVAVQLWLYCMLVIDVNLTSIHGLYRDRLASAYLVGQDTAGGVDVEEDVNLSEIGCHEAGSTAPYHLINAALNLQGSKSPDIRDRKSDFFVFSKSFIGSKHTGYCRTESMEQIHPTMSLATAMAISAAAASPNMGRGTNPAMVAFMVLANIRLGYWLPNPGRLEEELFGISLQQIKGASSGAKKAPPGFSFQEVFDQELVDVVKRWNNVYPNPSERKQRHLHVTDEKLTSTPSTEHGLVGISFSGGGIRSATINLGISQVFYERGIFDHVDYMSTVSGGGYLGSSISTLMRCKTKPNVRTHRSEIEGVVSLDTNALGEKIVRVTARSAPGEQREYRFSSIDPLFVKTGDMVRAGQKLIVRHNAIWDRISWRVKPINLVREMLMKLDETHKWVNLSDGGHIENLAGIELLRRRCKFIIIGDGEADPELTFNGLATLIRYARIDLGIHIEINLDKIRVKKNKEAVDQGKDNLSEEHFAFGTITYPSNDKDGQPKEKGYLLYLKSSYTGDEDEVIKEYRYRNPAFPHESTADQFFNENQFECYRALGQHIGEKAFSELCPGGSVDLSLFEKFADGMCQGASRWDES